MKTGHRKNHGKGFRVHVGPHSLVGALKNSQRIEAHPLKSIRIQPVGLQYCESEGVLKPEFRIKISKRFSVLIIHDRRGI